MGVVVGVIYFSGQVLGHGLLSQGCVARGDDDPGLVDGDEAGV